MGFFGAFHGAFGTVAYGFIGLSDLGGLEGLKQAFSKELMRIKPGV